MIAGTLGAAASSVIPSVPTMDHVRPTIGRPLILDILRAQLSLEESVFFCAVHFGEPIDGLMNITIDAGEYARVETIEIDIGFEPFDE